MRRDGRLVFVPVCTVTTPVSRCTGRTGQGVMDILLDKNDLVLAFYSDCIVGQGLGLVCVDFLGHVGDERHQLVIVPVSRSSPDIHKSARWSHLDQYTPHRSSPVWGRKWRRGALPARTWGTRLEVCKTVSIHCFQPRIIRKKRRSWRTGGRKRGGMPLRLGRRELGSDSIIQARIVQLGRIGV